MAKYYKKDTIYLDIDGHIRNVVFANTNLKKWQVFQFSKAKIMAKIQTNLKRRTKLENKQTNNKKSSTVNLIYQFSFIYCCTGLFATYSYIAIVQWYSHKSLVIVLTNRPTASNSSASGQVCMFVCFVVMKPFKVVFISNFVTALVRSK